jgi:hypothetical protein
MRSMNFITKGLLLKNLPSPLFAKESRKAFGIWQREVRRDFTINAFILAILSVTHVLNTIRIKLSSPVQRINGLSGL